METLREILLEILMEIIMRNLRISQFNSQIVGGRLLLKMKLWDFVDTILPDEHPTFSNTVR